MAQMIPELSQDVLASMKTAGERRFARRLAALLDEDCLVWYEPPVGTMRRYPDFVVLIPSRGLLFLEVKDWGRESIIQINSHHVRLSRAGTWCAIRIR